ncbi:MAG TPA: hypothetical protein VK034_00340, partial [Enhygromyxa sp.]|nr:hypothetical protein [Enhygromyxa sp.]
QSMQQYMIDGGRCTIDSVEYLEGDNEPYAKFRLSCVREIDQVEFDDFELRIGMVSVAELLEFAIGTEVDIRFEHQSWFVLHWDQQVFTMRDLDGVLLFAAGTQLFSPMTLDPDGTPRWAWSSIAGPDTDPAAVADWLAPLSPIELVDDACPVETFDGFVGDTERRFGLRASDDRGEFLAVDRSTRTSSLDGLSYEFVVRDASVWWDSDTPENAVAHVGVVLVLADG